ncbi:MAG: transglycosylase SLT domain-containing protein [Cyanobacteria bacterium CRU_2_1]|nr:transglycosylase SLT domain-containing protein [Cyanobacteria bacterium RU_5_0]NJR59803.1 transglycosylase SLT domain-containing protein [Cyanobacteria bacterium CRU_2_1]
MLKQPPKQRQLVRKPRKKKTLLLTGVGLGALALGGISALAFNDLLSQLPVVGGLFASQPEMPIADLSGEPSTVLALVTLPPAERAARLEEIANGAPSIDRHRAHYLLAVDLIEQNHGGMALPWLEGLENDYPVLAPQILAKRAQAYASTGNMAQAEATWKALLQQYPNDPASAEALFNLGKTNPHYWDQAIAQFPAHPRTVEMALTRLQQNPKQPQLMLILAKHGHYLPDIVSVLDRLKTEFGAQLTPQEWEAIAFAYWEKTKYGSAAEAYAKAPPTALNLYRAARGAQLDERWTTATQRYQVLIQAFPDAKETGLGLLRLANLSTSPETAILYLDQAINRFPDRAAEALVEKSKLLQHLNSPQAVIQTQQLVLTQYSHSDAAAELRWQQAEMNFKKGDIQAAWEWARQLVEQNPESEYAPEAGFWVGKWAAQLGRPQDAKQAYEYVLANYPESYYAWRSATLLEWDVGDFTTVRQKLPHVVQPTSRPEPLAGSEATRELYRLGQNREAWAYWQVEFTNRVEPPVAEQFTDGLMRMGVNDNLDGIFMLSSLEFRESPKERKEYDAIKQQIGYWQALYPFPFSQSIEQWAQQRQLNPMLVMALIRQESRFEPEIRSVAGAVGLMQVMPDTADWVASQIKLKQYNLENPNDNINLGTWYLDFTHREYSNHSLLAVASYNAGPGSVADWIARFGTRDPDVFVEQIPFGETKGYVESVFENYWNYLRLYNPEISQKLAQISSKHSVLIEAVNQP